jgi:hypothetical protein
VDGHNDERGANVLYPDVPVTRDKVNFIEPMLLLPAETLPEGSGWTYELKLVGFRAGKAGIASASAIDLNGDGLPGSRQILPGFSFLPRLGNEGRDIPGLYQPWLRVSNSATRSIWNGKGSLGL